MAEIPNLVGIATNDLVESIGSGRFEARYINWSRTMNLLRQHAPGWLPVLLPDTDDNYLHRSPKGGFVTICFVHTDGTQTPAVPQAVMDNRNNSIPYESISSRDFTDTHRRGVCMAAAFTFGLASELWAKMPLESGYGVYVADEDEMPSRAPKAAAQAAPEATREDFLENCLEIGLTSHAADVLLAKIGDKYAGGIKTLQTKDETWVAEMNASSQPEEKAKKPARQTKPKAESEPDPSEY